MIFDVVFVVLCLICGVLCYMKYRTSACSVETQEATRVIQRDFQAFQRSYLFVYVCAMMGDWLQGPYVYALYAAYNFSKQQIAILFIVGFGTSGIIGAFAGQFADKYGRRLSCYVYCVAYIISCLTKHSSNFHFLLLGRLTGGLATSILFSSFEAWLVSEHNKRSYPVCAAS